MKNFKRDNLLFSLGLNCGLCPMKIDDTVRAAAEVLKSIL